MKKIMNLLLFAVLISTLSECKKGEDDPFISFRSRKNRVVGEWTLTSGTEKTSTVSGNPSTTINTDYTYTQDSYIRTNTTMNQSGSTSVSSSGYFYYKITFRSNGEYTLVRERGGSFTQESGVWNFTKGVGDYKRKEQIALVPQITPNSLTTSRDVTKTFTLKELRNRVMTIVSEETDNATTTYQNGSFSSTSSSSSSSISELTFERIKEKDKK